MINNIILCTLILLKFISIPCYSGRIVISHVKLICDEKKATILVKSTIFHDILKDLRRVPVRFEANAIAKTII